MRTDATITAALNLVGKYERTSWKKSRTWPAPPLSERKGVQRAKSSSGTTLIEGSATAASREDETKEKKTEKTEKKYVEQNGGGGTEKTIGR